MDEDTAIINSNTRNEKIKDFFIKNKKLLISFLVIILVLLIGYFAVAEYQDKKKIKISDQYNKTVFEYSSINKENTKNTLIEIIYKKDSTYSPLALYFIIEISSSITKSYSLKRTGVFLHFYNILAHF